MILGKRHHELDEIDLRLVDELQKDCKQPLAQLGEIVGLSAPSVMERIRKLEQGGVIRGYHAALDARAVGLDVTAFIGLSFNYPKQMAGFEQWIRSDPRILECHHITGDYTLMMKVRVKSTAALEELISTLRGIEGVERTQTMVVLSTHTERAELPLEVPPLPPAGARPKRKRRAPARADA